jgi:hypothetical protein
MKIETCFYIFGMARFELAVSRSQSELIEPDYDTFRNAINTALFLF